MTRPPDFYFIFWKAKWKENGLQTAKCIAEGEVWRQDYKMQTIVWMVKPLSAGCVNTVATRDASNMPA